MILSVDTTHLLMASEDSVVVGMKAVPQTPQGPQRLTCVFYEQSAKYSSSAADTLEFPRACVCAAHQSRRQACAPSTVRHSPSKTHCFFGATHSHWSTGSRGQFDWNAYP